MSFSVAQAKANMHGMYGNYTGAMDNAKTTAYRAAVRAFRRRHGIAPSQYFTQECITASVSEVKELQSMLSRLGFSVGAAGIDGRFGLVDGGATGAAVEAYQRTRNLRADRIAGSMTLSALRAEYAAKTRPQSAGQTGRGIDFGKYPNFKASEFACRGGWCCDGSLHLLTEDIVAVAQRIRSHFGRPLIITKVGGVRCDALNRVTQGSIAGSQHTKGKAIDFYIPGVGVSAVLAYCRQLQSRGVIRYCYTNNTNMRGAVHVEVG